MAISYISGPKNRVVSANSSTCDSQVAHEAYVRAGVPGRVVKEAIVLWSQAKNPRGLGTASPGAKTKYVLPAGS